MIHRTRHTQLEPRARACVCAHRYCTIPHHITRTHTLAKRAAGSSGGFDVRRSTTRRPTTAGNDAQYSAPSHHAPTALGERTQRRRSKAVLLAHLPIAHPILGRDRRDVVTSGPLAAQRGSLSSPIVEPSMRSESESHSRRSGGLDSLDDSLGGCGVVVPRKVPSDSQ